MPGFAASKSYLMLYVEGVDAVYERALRAGATSIAAPADQFYGDRTATVEDMFGNRWTMGTHIEDVSDEELARRMSALSG